MDSKQYKEICKLLKECRKLGVSSFTLEGLSFTFKESEPQRQSPKVTKSLQKTADEIEEKGKQSDNELEDDLRTAQLIVDDFDEFERQSVHKLRGDQ